jgi:hypothetical protein
MSRNSSQVTLDRSHYDEDDGTFRIKFGSSMTFKDMEMAVVRLSMYHSFPNCSSSIGNNHITFYWPSGSGHISYDITIPDSFFTIKTFEDYLKEEFEKRGLYTLAADGVTKQHYLFFGTNASMSNIMFWYEVSQSAVPPSGSTWVTPTATLSPYIDLETSAWLFFLSPNRHRPVSKPPE